MAVVDITEYTQLARDALGNVMPVGGEPAPNQQVAIGAGSVQSTAFGDNVRLVRVHTDAPCRVAFGVNPTASASSKRMASGQTEYFGVRPGDKVAVITTT